MVTFGCSYMGMKARKSTPCNPAMVTAFLCMGGFHVVQVHKSLTRSKVLCNFRFLDFLNCGVSGGGLRVSLIINPVKVFFVCIKLCQVFNTICVPHWACLPSICGEFPCWTSGASDEERFPQWYTVRKKKTGRGFISSLV